MRWVQVLLIGIVILLILPTHIHAASSHVLPYPGIMPGNKLYVIKELKNDIQYVWSFGNLSRFKYHLNLADEYLVEARTLFDYGQYLHALESLEKSTPHLLQARHYATKLSEKGIEDESYKLKFNNAIEKHIEVRDEIQSDTPVRTSWVTEEGMEFDLEIHSRLDSARSIKML